MQNDTSELQLFLEEAKSMVQIDEYHNHIVNLQGIIYEHDDQQSETLKVLNLIFIRLELLSSYIIPKRYCTAI